MYDQQWQPCLLNELSSLTFQPAYRASAPEISASLRLLELPNTSDIISTLYDGVHDDSQWQTAMEQLAYLLNGAQVSLLVLGKTTGSVVVEERYGAASSLIKLGDDVLSFIAHHPARGEWVTEKSLLWLTLENPGDVLLSIVFAGEHDSRGIDTLASLTKHLQRAVQLRFRFKKATETAGLELMLLDRLNSALLVVDASGEVLISNRAAKLWMQDMHGSGSKKDQLALQLKTLAEKIFHSDDPASVFASKHSLSTAEGWYFLGLPILYPGTPSGAFVKAAAVLVHRDGRGNTARADLFRSLFGLSPAEAGLLECLVEHDCLHRCSASLGISKETARSHLKSIYRKTGVNKQSSLIRLIVQLSQLQ